MNKIAERCKHGMDPRFCSLCNAPRPPARRSNSTRKRSALSGDPVVRHIDHRFENDGRQLVVTADLVKGWRRERRSPDADPMKTFCFSEVADAEWQGGTIHIQVSAFPRPGGLTDEWAAAPPNLTRYLQRRRVLMHAINPDTGENKSLGVVEDCCEIRLSEGVFVALIDLLDESGRKPRPFFLHPNSGGHLMFERLFRESVLSDKPYKQLDVQLRLTFKPPQRPAPIEYSFWNDFLPGGRPESNRRKF